MRELIAKRLAEMKSPGERAILREIMSDIFLPLYDQTEAKYAMLEQRVRDELPLLYDTYTVYSTVMQREYIDDKHAYLSAMIPAETEKADLKARDLIQALQDREQPTIETVFLEADYLRCQRIARDKQILNGAFVTNTGKIQFKCQMQPAKRYTDRVETLYKAFLRNDVPWTTINAAYQNKFFDVKLASMGDMPSNAKIQEAEISFAPYEDCVRRGLIPVWNVDVCQMKGGAFPEAVEDSINYEYEYSVSKLGLENGFLVDFDSGFILSVRRAGDKFVVVSPKQQGLVWNLYRLRSRQDTAVDMYHYPVLSNKRRDNFSARLSLKYGTRVATPAAMRTLMLSLELSEYLTLVDFRFASDKVAGDTYDMNPFIRDEIRDPDYQKTLVLAFRANRREFFINRDILSFMVSEFQAAYPEYRCVGTLV